MKGFDEYFSFDSIVEQLVIQRAKLTFFIHKNSYLDSFFKGKGFEIAWASSLEFETAPATFLERSQRGAPRATPSDALMALLRGDLDAIVMKARH